MRAQIEALKAAIGHLPRGLADHIERVVAEARRLAARFQDLDGERVELAAWGHDIARALSPQELLARVHELGLEVDPVEEQAPILLHGPVGAEILRHQYGIDDAEVLAAARFHSTGRAGMSLLEKVIFVADKIEPGKVQAKPALATVRALADDDLDGAILEYLDQMLETARQERWPLHPDAVAARNELLLARRG
ncbi:MAG: bis(5'-nucleosyl)-tetraphosphatase (symmetrical) YqeK [Dehalococcoidia bacterium]